MDSRSAAVNVVGRWGKSSGRPLKEDAGAWNVRPAARPRRRQRETLPDYVGAIEAHGVEVLTRTATNHRLAVASHRAGKSDSRREVVSLRGRRIQTAQPQFATDRDGNSEIYVMNADGSNQTRLIDQAFSGSGNPAWSPDGSQIAFTHGGQICVMNASGGSLTCLTRITLTEAQTQPAWSPDGTRISYTTIPIFSDQWTSDDEIFVMNGNGGNVTNLTNTPSVIDGQSAWSPDGARIAFWSFRDGNDEIYVMNADGGNPTRITNNLDAINQDPDWQVLPPTPNSTVQFSVAGYSVIEGAGSAAITVTRTGDASAASTVNFASSDGGAFTACNTVNGLASSRCDYATAFGTLSFAAGEVTKDFSLSIVDDVHTEGSETLALTLSNPTGANLGAQSSATLTINDDDNGSASNPIEDPAFFVRQHYLDFLNRQPDPSGLLFWTNEIASCGSDPQCVEVKRINVSAAFFLSIEFQETGYLAYRAYKAAYGDATSPGVPGTVPVIRLAELLADSQYLGQGVQVGIGDWQARLEANKQSYALEFVQRQRFKDDFPLTMSAEAFVSKLDQHAGGVLSADEKAQLVTSLAPDPSEPRRRAGVLRAVADDADLRQAQFNRAFVLMQYYGYLRRNPHDPQDTDFQGWEFWLNKLNQHNGNFVRAEMVKSFLMSIEYRQRFGPTMSR